MATSAVVNSTGSRRGMPLSAIKVSSLPVFVPKEQQIHEVKPAVAPEVVVEPAKPAIVADPVVEPPDDEVTFEAARKHMHGLQEARNKRLGSFSDELTRYDDAIAAIVACGFTNSEKVRELRIELHDNEKLLSLMKADLKATRKKKFAPLCLLKDLEQAVNATERAYYALQVESLNSRACQLQWAWGMLSDEQRYAIVDQFHEAATALQIFALTVKLCRPLGTTSKTYLDVEEKFKGLARAMPWPEEKL